MPYPRSLDAYVLPEFYAEPPESWERRLREVSPIRGDLDHLVLRYFAPHESWACKDRGQWVLYSAKRIQLVDKDRAKQFERHWSELPTEQQEGRKAVVSDYQHFMWHSRGLYVKPFLILQGPWGGTPAKYEEQEIAFLQASECFDEPFPIGTFPACPFDERVVTQIANRDRMLQCANDYNALARLDTPDVQRATTEAAQLVKRQTFLDTWKIMIQPSADFFAHFLKRSENRESLPPAPEGTAKHVAMWRDHWLEHGSIIGAGPAAQRQVQMAVR